MEFVRIRHEILPGETGSPVVPGVLKHPSGTDTPRSRKYRPLKSDRRVHVAARTFGDVLKSRSRQSFQSMIGKEATTSMEPFGKLRKDRA